ncbi:MAG: phosphoribosylformimino-5-aminoimidazole carboxamide ribotide isomerase [Candidatus Nitrosomirales archaeon]|jgi:phosphoribosylformimino-5-aminoimidazole carboxamide ribotide isomerase
MKIIPAVDLLDGKVVRLVKGDPKNKIVYSDDPVGTAKKWEHEGADALHIVDLDATLTRGSNASIVNKITEQVSIPVQVAGGIRSIDLAQELLKNVDKVVLGTLAYKDPESVEKLVNEFGADKIVIAIDQMHGKVMIDGWRKSSGMDMLDAIEKFKQVGVNYFLLTSIDRDGTLSGPDIDVLNKACGKNVNIIASGGISKNEDISKVKQTGAYAVILGKALYDGKVDIKHAKEIVKID